MEKDFGVKHTQTWAWRGWVIPWKRGFRVEKNSRVKGAQA